MLRANEENSSLAASLGNCWAFGGIRRLAQGGGLWVSDRIVLLKHRKCNIRLIRIQNSLRPFSTADHQVFHFAHTTPAANRASTCHFTEIAGAHPRFLHVRLAVRLPSRPGWRQPTAFFDYTSGVFRNEASFTRRPSSLLSFFCEASMPCWLCQGRAARPSGYHFPSATGWTCGWPEAGAATEAPLFSRQPDVPIFHGFLRSQPPQFCPPRNTHKAACDYGYAGLGLMICSAGLFLSGLRAFSE